jgi:hypothetical protein
MKDDEKNINLKKKLQKKNEKIKRKDEEELIQVKRKRKLLKRFLYIKIFVFSEIVLLYYT